MRPDLSGPEQDESCGPGGPRTPEQRELATRIERARQELTHFLQESRSLWSMLGHLVERARSLDTEIHCLFTVISNDEARDQRARQEARDIHEMLQGLKIISWHDEGGPYAPAPGPSTPYAAALEAETDDLEQQLHALAGELSLARESLQGRLVMDFRRLQQTHTGDPLYILAEALSREVHKLEEIHALVSRFSDGEVSLEDFIRGPVPGLSGKR